MKIIIIVIGVVCALYFAINITEWKTFSLLKKFFKILSIIVMIVSAWYSLTDQIKKSQFDDSYDYLLKNRAKLISLLYIDNIHNDSISYHLKIKNINSISAKNIKFSLLAGENFEGEEIGIDSEIGKDESHLIYPTVGNAMLERLDNGTFSLQFIIYYNSVWGEDTLQHKENFVFFVPSNQLGLKEYEPISKLTDKVLNKTEIDSTMVANQVKKDTGTMYFVVFKDQLKSPISYIFRTDSATLFFQNRNQDLVFQKLFSNGELLNLQKHIEPNKSKGYIITLVWSKSKYSLGVNNDPDETVYRKNGLILFLLSLYIYN